MIQLNRKHKAGLFLTLIAVGVGLLLDADVNVVAGVAVLGVAASWLIGSLTFGLGACKAMASALIGLFSMMILGATLRQREQASDTGGKPCIEPSASRPSS